MASKNYIINPFYGLAKAQSNMDSKIKAQSLPNNNIKKSINTMEYKTTFAVAVKWCNNSLIRCNEIAHLDETIWDNMRFALDEEDEIFQYYITDCTEDDVEFLESHFTQLYFTYSEMLDKYILCVTHWGTAWDYVMIETDIQGAKAEQGDFWARIRLKELETLAPIKNENI